MGTPRQQAEAYAASMVLFPVSQVGSYTCKKQRHRRTANFTHKNEREHSASLPSCVSRSAIGSLSIQRIESTCLSQGRIGTMEPFATVLPTCRMAYASQEAKIDLILATETSLRRSTFPTCESVDDVAKRPRQKTV